MRLSGKPIQPISRKRRTTVFIILSITVLAILCAAGGLAVIVTRPGTAAEVADVLRGIIGDHAVAQLETIVYQAQDAYLKLKYRAGGAEPVAPWQDTPTSASAAIALPPASPTPAPSRLPSSTPTPEPTVTGTPLPSLTPTITPTPTEMPWFPRQVIGMGTLQGEGVWSAYITSPEGKVNAYRTFLQPDPNRPYSVVAIIAFDLKAVRLNYVLGSEEPVSQVKIDRSGRIPTEIASSPDLLAVFNGGFKTRHGLFGVMVGENVLVPMRDGLGTLVIYPDGRVKVGEWGEDIDGAPGPLVWRQNGPLVIQDGGVNPLVRDAGPDVWGYTIKEAAAIWRSGIGVSSDGRTLYIFAGPSLTLEALARAMAASGASDAIQLDINNYWVHFDTVEQTAQGPLTHPLFKEMGAENCARFLYRYPKDYFYITAVHP